MWEPGRSVTKEQFAFNRVNSFIAGGQAAIDDVDLVEDTPSDREDGTDSLVHTYKRDTPGERTSTAKTIIRSIKSRRRHA